MSKPLRLQWSETSRAGFLPLATSVAILACIGLSDQAPAAMINDIVVTSLTEETVRAYLQKLKAGCEPKELIETCGDGNNADPRIHSMVNNNIRLAGPVLLEHKASGKGLHKALTLPPGKIIEKITASGLRGRGGAGFPCGKKWQVAASVKAASRTCFDLEDM